MSANERKKRKEGKKKKKRKEKTRTVKAKPVTVSQQCSDLQTRRLRKF
jgi:hypothetical protein